VAQLGRLDNRSPQNAGITSYGTLAELPEQTWQGHDRHINLTGEWHAATGPRSRTCGPAGRGGSMILTSSELGLRAIAETPGTYNPRPSTGVVGLMRHPGAWSWRRDFIRVNGAWRRPQSTLPMVMKFQRPTGLVPPGPWEDPTADDMAEAARAGEPRLPIPWVEPVDISNGPCFGWPRTSSR